MEGTRKYLSIWLVVVILLPWAWSAALGQPLVKAVGAIGMTVSDIDRSVEFFSRVLSFEKVSDVELWGDEWERLHGLFGLRMRVVRMKLGEDFIELTEYLAPRGRPVPIDSRSHDQWFQHIAIVVSDMEKAYHHLRHHKVQHASTAPQRLPDWNKAAAGIEAFYFKDPDGHNLEIIYFPPGKGDPKWRRGGQRLFLGIDHTAIVVTNTKKSSGFYRDLMGMKLAGESENHGPEQERLNNVFGARLRISALKSEAGPGIEFLEYLAPRDGRKTPRDAKVNDLWHWQTGLVVEAADDAVKKLLAGKAEPISSQVVAPPKNRLGFKKGFLVRDPDHHALQLTEK